MQKQGSESPKKSAGNQLELPKVGSLPKDIQKECSQSDVSRNSHFMKKLPAGAEASNVLVGEVDFLQRHITAFVRLSEARILGDLTEVSGPFYNRNNTTNNINFLICFCKVL